MQPIYGLKGDQLEEFERKYAAYTLDRMLQSFYLSDSRYDYKAFFSANDVVGLCQHLNEESNTFPGGEGYFSIALEYKAWFDQQDWESTLSLEELEELGYTFIEAQ